MTTTKTTPSAEEINSATEQHIEKDEFCAPEYTDPYAKLPRIQALRGTNPETCGYFVAVEQMATSGWVNFDESQLVTYVYESGEKQEGVMLSSPRMLVCPKTPVLGFDREKAFEEKVTVILGRYTQEYKANAKIGNLQFFQLFLLDEQNKPLHQVPLLYRATGANQATFSVHWQQFCQELNTCHSIVNGIAAKAKSNLFNSLGVFCFKTSRLSAGTKKTSLSCQVVEHEQPKIETWRNYFIGFDEKTKQYIHESLEPQQPLSIPPAILTLPSTGTGENTEI